MSTTSASTVLAPEPGRAALAREAARADLARFIAACYYEPGPEFAEEGLFGSIAAAAALVDGELAETAQRLGQAFANTGLESLLVDHTQLFLGPVQAAARPYAAVWLSGQPQLMQASTVGVLELYAEAGFEVDEAFRDLPDHVAVELEFLYLLLHQGTMARVAGDAAAQAAWTQRRERFLTQHMGLWLGSFLLAQHDHARTSFYRELAELAERFVRLAGTQ